MKKSITLFVCTCMFMLLGALKSMAQCAIVGENAEGVIVTIPISCTFPVLLDTGNPEADSEDYDAQKSLWVQNFPQDYAALTNLSSFSHFEIHQSDFDAMSDLRKTAILANTEQYHIVP